MPKLMNAQFFELPHTTGSYAVGVQSIHLIDQHRQEPYKPDTPEKRELMATMWYPAHSTTDTLSTYAPEYLMDSIKGLFKSFDGITEKDVEELGTIRVHATPDAPIAEHGKSFPLILFSHGYYGSRFYCSALCQELASHGYVVIAIDHTYDCGITQFPNGRIAKWANLTDAQLATDEFYSTFDTRIEIRVADISFVIDSAIRQTIPLCAHVNTQRIGIFGHSLGAAAALQASTTDKRITAVAAMDSFPVGPILPDSWNTPCIMLSAERTDWSKLECSEAIHAKITKQLDAYNKHCINSVVLKDADHVVFSDFALFSRMNIFKKLPTEGHMFAIGAVDGFEAIATTQKHLVAFFDKELKGIVI